MVETLCIAESDFYKVLLLLEKDLFRFIPEVTLLSKINRLIIVEKQDKVIVPGQTERDLPSIRNTPLNWYRR